MLKTALKREFTSLDHMRRYMAAVLTIPRLFRVPGWSAALYLLTSKASLWEAVTPYLDDVNGFDIIKAQDLDLDNDDYRLLRLAMALYIDDQDGDLGIPVAEIWQFEDDEALDIAMAAIKFRRAVAC